MEVSQQNKLEIDILKEQLSFRFQEMLFHSQRYHSQANYIYIYFSVIISLSAFFLSDSAQIVLKNIDATEVKWLISISLIFISLILFYLIASLMDALYAIYINGVQMASLEKSINERVGGNFLKWESEIIPLANSPQFWKYKRWIKPSYLVSTVVFLLCILLMAMLIFIWYSFVKVGVLIYAITLLIGTLFFAYQWLMLHIDGIEFLRKIIGVSVSPPSTLKSSKNRITSKDKALTYGFLVPLFTLLLGIVPFVILSFLTDTLWINSKYDIPLITLPTIVIGDSIFLPLFNYKFYNLLINTKILGTIKKENIFWAITSLLLLSLGINSSVHYSWVNDVYTGFMDIEFGKLTVAGWWHYGFSTIQMLIIFCFLVLWFFSARKNINLHREFRNVWKTIIIFTSLSLFDFAIKVFYLFPKSNLLDNNSIISAVMLCIPLLISLFIPSTINIFRK